MTSANATLEDELLAARNDQQMTSWKAFAEWVGASDPSMIYRWRREGRLGRDWADRLERKTGRHFGRFVQDRSSSIATQSVAERLEAVAAQFVEALAELRQILEAEAAREARVTDAGQR